MAAAQHLIWFLFKYLKLKAVLCQVLKVIYFLLMEDGRTIFCLLSHLLKSFF